MIRRSRSRSPLALTALVTAATLAAGILSSGAVASASPEPAAAPIAVDDPTYGSRFTLAVLPDTQFYSRYAQSNFIPDYGTDPFATQTQWIVDNAEALNIPFAAHVGDVVDQAGQGNQWSVADEAMETLDAAGLPYSILAGNHDVLNSDDSLSDTDYALSQEPFLQTFTAERAASQPTQGGTDATGFNSYQIFEAEGQQFLVLALSWRVSDATLDWANSVIDANPTLPIILTSHDIISIDGDGNGVTSANGERLWDELIADNDQIFLTLNGHYHGAAMTQRANNAGNQVTQLLMDYQMAYEGGNGYLSLLEFDLSNDTLNLATVSPWVAQKDSDQLTSYDEPVLTGPGQDLTVSINFAERFSDFNSDFDAGEGQYPPLNQLAKSIVTKGFPGVPSTSLEKPGSTDDYVEVDGTLAHWQMSGTVGTFAEDATIEDIAGDNDLHRATIAESGSSTAQSEDVRISNETHIYSSSGQSVCFDNSDKRENRFSYLTTAADAPVNNADLSAGYTVETFVKLDASWSTDGNSWSKALVRSGNRSQLEGMPWSQWDYTASPTALGISSLREFQWTEVGNDTTKGDKTNWSGEIMPDTWAHVAIVNDPATAETTMYVDGAPVLRTAQDTVGMSFNENMSWVIGSDWVDDKATNGWNGCVGETRIVDHPLERSEWLTARSDITTLEVAQPEVVAADAETVQLTGTGTPRATVTVQGSANDVAVTVDGQGNWNAEVPASAIAVSGTDLSLVQGFGTRVADAIAITLVREEGESAAPEPTTTLEPTNTVGPTDSAQPTPTDGAVQPRPSSNGGTTEPDANDSEDGLAHTGGVDSAWLIAVGAALVLAGAWLIGRRGASTGH